MYVGEVDMPEAVGVDEDVKHPAVVEAQTPAVVFVNLHEANVVRVLVIDFLLVGFPKHEDAVAALGIGMAEDDGFGGAEDAFIGAFPVDVVRG